MPDSKAPPATVLLPAITREAPTALEAQILPITKIVVKDGAGEKTYQLVLDYNAIAKAQAHPELSKRRIADNGAVRFGARDLSQILHWSEMTGPDLTLIAWAALDRYHPEVELRTVRQWLAPAQFDQLFAMLLEQCYPGVLEKIREALGKKTLDTAEAPPAPETAEAAS